MAERAIAAPPHNWAQPIFDAFPGVPPSIVRLLGEDTNYDADLVIAAIQDNVNRFKPPEQNTKQNQQNQQNAEQNPDLDPGDIPDLKRKRDQDDIGGNLQIERPDFQPASMQKDQGQDQAVPSIPASKFAQEVYTKASLRILEHDQEFLSVPVHLIRQTFSQNPRLLVAYGTLQVIAKNLDGRYEPRPQMPGVELWTVAKMENIIRKQPLPGFETALREYQHILTHYKKATIKPVEKKLAEQHKVNLQKDNREQNEDEKDNEDHSKEQKVDDILVECGCCFSECVEKNMVHCNGENEHSFCIECARRNAEMVTMEMRFELRCISTDLCAGTFSQSQRERFLTPTLADKLQANELAASFRVEGAEDLTQCPFCHYAEVYPPVEEQREFACRRTECGRNSCRLCRRDVHPHSTCEAASRRGNSDEAKRLAVEEAMTSALVRRCNKCNTPFIKEAGCNKMTCPSASCNNKQCYVCGKSIFNYNHFKGSGPAYAGRRCPLNDGDVDDDHEQQVLAAEHIARQQVLKENPGIDAKALQFKFAPGLEAADRATRTERRTKTQDAARGGLGDYLRLRNGQQLFPDVQDADEQMRRHPHALAPLPRMNAPLAPATGGGVPAEMLVRERFQARAEAMAQARAWAKDHAQVLAEARDQTAAGVRPRAETRAEAVQARAFGQHQNWTQARTQSQTPVTTPAPAPAPTPATSTQAANPASLPAPMYAAAQHRAPTSPPRLSEHTNMRDLWRELEQFYPERPAGSSAGNVADANVEQQHREARRYYTGTGPTPQYIPNPHHRLAHEGRGPHAQFRMHGRNATAPVLNLAQNYTASLRPTMHPDHMQARAGMMQGPTGANGTMAAAVAPADNWIRGDRQPMVRSPAEAAANRAQLGGPGF